MKMRMNDFGLFVLLSIALLGCFVEGHNYLVNPASRANQKATETGCRYGGEGSPTCAGPCDRKKGQSTQGVININRGDTIDVQWSRHNHPGGFIRFAWSPTDDSDAHSSFDSYVDHFVCKDAGGCGPANANSPTGTPNGKNCKAPVTVPNWLSNGKWTLQWAYFGGYYNAGDYYACVDYNIVGGPTGTRGNVYFNGGDFTYPNEQKCLFYTTNALHVCTVEPCTNGTFPAGARSGAPAGVGASPPTSAPTPAPTPKPTQTPAPTPKPTQTPAPTPKPTSTPKPTQTPAPTQAPTQTPAPTRTPAPNTPAPTQSSGTGCVLGQQKCSGSSTYQTCGWVSRSETGWSANQHCPSGLSCHTVQETYVWCY